MVWEHRLHILDDDYRAGTLESGLNGSGDSSSSSALVYCSDGDSFANSTTRK